MKSLDDISAENASARAVIRNLWTWLIFLGVFLVLALVVNLVLVYNIFYRFPIKQFVWTSDAHAVCEATPLTEPNISQARLKDFVAAAAVQLNSYDYANWRPLINNALTQSFTARGRERYRRALQESEVIDKVVTGYQVVSSVTIDPPNIAQEGRDAGRYFWTVEVPLRIFYKTNVETKIENRLFTATVIRVEPSPINPNGIAIDGVVSTQLLTNQVRQ